MIASVSEPTTTPPCDQHALTTPRPRRGFAWARALRRRLAGAAGFALLVCAAAGAARAEPVSVRVREEAGHTRLELTWPETSAGAVRAAASVENNVYVARFDRPAQFDPATLAEASDRIAIARLDPDQRTLRLALRRPVRATVSTSYNVVGLDLVDPDAPDPPPVVSARERAERQAAARRAQELRRAQAESEAAAAPAPPLPLKVRAVEAAEYTRIVFDWTRPVDFALETEPERAVVRFAADAAPDLTALSVIPPRGVRAASATRDGGRLAVTLDIAPEYAVRAWRDDARVVVDVYPSAPAAPAVSDAEAVAARAQAPAAAPEPAAAPVVASAPLQGPVRAEVTRLVNGVSAAFAWPAPVGAAAFRRGDSVWIVFDAPAELDVRGFQVADARLIQGGETVRGPDHAAVRLDVSPGVQIAADQGGARWVFTIAEARSVAPAPAAVQRLSRAGEPGRVRVGLAGARRALGLVDPVLNDRLLIVTADAPARGVFTERRYLEMTVLASAHGIVVEPRADDLTATVEAQAVILSRPGGLTLSPNRPIGSGEEVLATASPGFVDFAGLAAPPGGFADAYAARIEAAALADAPAEPLLEAAHFLLAHDLAAEALGAIAEALRTDPSYINDPRLRALRGVAHVMLDRRADAARDFAIPALASDPATALWRSRLAVTEHDWRTARRAYLAGEEALYLYPPERAARFMTDGARAALELGDAPAALALAEEVLRNEVSEPVRLRARRVVADYHERLGDLETALAVNRELAAAAYPPLEAAALFNIVRLERALGDVTPEEAIERLEQLRLRWRGDDVELAVAHELARTYREAGDTRAGLMLMRTIVKRFPEHPLTRAIAIDMADTFRAMFLDDAGDATDPIEALALWYEFRDLTPVGADGDRLIRRLADRLVDFDLLPQAAELLQHQVDNRLRGASRALIGTDLAALYLMDRNPEAALRVIADTRIARLPEAVNRERRLVQARALAELGRYDHAFELLSIDRSTPAARLRADIAWRAQDWPKAGRLLADSLGDAWRTPAPLTADETSRVLRAAVALTLAGDEAALEALEGRYGVKMARSGQAAAWSLVTAETRPEGVRLEDLAREIAAEDTVQAFVREFRARRAADDAQAEAQAEASAASEAAAQAAGGDG